ncbi:hypothetical protein M407DRAFT_21719 [Tulasnella calospora MUT 4182]|uniref:RING-type E3 ubiquitin transferase n=1 Tax=Tulasnella calospora MUT 4182 TaxID=1051891 RepID=A0A0C3QDN9_9AGAM|nr:hypothetical protein M407DRAFT_21719 [Tulasnella calospora MUT 4182]
MATAVQQQSQATNRGRGGPRGRGRRTNNRGRGRGGASITKSPSESAVDEVTDELKDTTISPAEEDIDTPANEEGEPDVCWICAEKIKYYSLGECNHITCHVCALRLRALYKKNECTFCKEPQNTIIFASTADKPFQDHDLASMQFGDTKLAIRFETQEIMEDSLLILRFNCPDDSCDVIGNGWADLKWHVKDTHKRLLCDLCIRNKKIFAHEHTTYTPDQLHIHLPSMRRTVGAGPRHGKQKDKETGSHPMCEFCRDCYYGDDELFAHMRERHEECFICKKQGILHQHFQNWQDLEVHFKKEHFPCQNPACLEKKFIVFPTSMDLQGHMVDEHSDSMTSKDKKGARRVEMAFAFAPAHRGGGAGGGGGPPDPPGPSSSSQPGAGTMRRTVFGAQLSTPSGSSGSGAPSRNLPGPSTAASGPSFDRSDTDQVLQQYADLTTFLGTLGPSANGIIAIRAAIRSWRSSESTVYDMLETIFTVLERNMDKMSKVIDRLVPIFEGEKRSELLDAWGGMKAQQERRLPGTRATQPDQMDFAGVSSGRVINVKQQTTRSRGGRDRVEQAATSSTVPLSAGQLAQRRLVPGALPPEQPNRAFPALAGASSRPSPAGGSWAPGLYAPVPRPAPVIRSEHVGGKKSGGRKNNGPPAPSLSQSAFPALPTVKDDLPKDFIGGANAGYKPFGTTPPPVTNAWGSGPKPTPSRSNTANAGGSNNRSQQQPSGGKDKKGKGKQTLFTLGSLPT